MWKRPQRRDGRGVYPRVILSEAKDLASKAAFHQLRGRGIICEVPRFARNDKPEAITTEFLFARAEIFR
jgi:hypothetical protein